MAQAPLAEELKGVFTALDAFGGKQAEEFREHATRFFLNYFKQIAKVFPKAWHGKRYSIKTAMALRAFLRVVPDVLAAIRKSGGDPLEAVVDRQRHRAVGRVHRRRALRDRRRVAPEAGRRHARHGRRPRARAALGAARTVARARHGAIACSL